MSLCGLEVIGCLHGGLEAIAFDDVFGRFNLSGLSGATMLVLGCFLYGMASWLESIHGTPMAADVHELAVCVRPLHQLQAGGVSFGNRGGRVRTSNIHMCENYHI